MTTHLELGHIPSGVLVSRPLNMSERRLICGNVAMNVEREFDYNNVKLCTRTEEGEKSYISRTCAFPASRQSRQSGRATGILIAEMLPKSQLVSRK